MPIKFFNPDLKKWEESEDPFLFFGENYGVLLVTKSGDDRVKIVSLPTTSEVLLVAVRAVSDQLDFTDEVWAFSDKLFILATDFLMRCEEEL